MESIHTRLGLNSPRCGDKLLRGNSRGRRNVLLQRLMAACFAAATVSASRQASATHVYGIVWNPAVPAGYADLGAEVDLEPTALSSSSCSEFVNHEFWYGLDQTPNYWVEVGFKDGLTGSSGCVDQELFWAENSTSHGYQEYYPAYSWSYGSIYTVWVQQNATNPCGWGVNINTTSLGLSSFNCGGTGRYLAAGIEATSTSAGTAQGWAGNVGHIQTTTAGWLPGWDGTSFYYDNPPNIRWWSGPPTNTWTQEWLNDPF